ncbi:hypothetical protein M9458_052963, partial [Cirrhinus mrigala]
SACQPCRGPTPQLSARKRSGAGELATPAGVSTAAGSAVSCRSSATGHRSSSSNNTRDQSREQGLVAGPSSPGFTAGTSLLRLDLKDAYLHISILQHRKFLSVGFFHPALHSHPTLLPSVWMLLWLLWTPEHPHTGLYQQLLIIDRFRALGVRHRDVVLAHMKVLGLRLNAKKTTYLGVVWDLTTMQARLSPARIESILTAVVRVRKSLTVKQFQQLLGLMAAVSNVIPFGLLYMRLLQWWLRTKRFSPRGNPFHASRSHGDTYVPWTCGGNLSSCLRAWCWELLVAACHGRPPCPWSV